MSNRRSIPALVAALLLVGATCDGGPETTQSPTGPTSQATPPAGEVFTYRIATFEETTTDNYWASLDSEASSWNSYVLEPTKPALFEVRYPGLEVEPDAAAAPLPQAVQEGQGWTVTVPIRDDAVWSDEEPITAEDVVFTFETVRDLGLGGNWLSLYPLPDPESPDKVGIVSVEALDDKTVKITFNGRPGLAIWPFQVGQAPIMPGHFWEATVEEAKASEDPATTLYGASGAGEPSGGPMILTQWEPGGFVRLDPNRNWYRGDEGVNSGGVSYVLGPFSGQETQSLYKSQDAAVLALRDGEVDFMLNPIGMTRGLQQQVIGDAELASIVNASNGYRYLGFNLRRAPMSIKAFRQALAVMIDKEFVAESVLQGVAYPLYTHLPQGNAAFWDQPSADAISSRYVGMTEEQRLNEAVGLLKEAGFTWARDPAWNTETGSVEAGQGMRMPDGQPVKEIELLTPGPAYDALRATYAVWIQQFGNSLGIPIRAESTDFNTIGQKVFGEVDFDMYVFGWGLTIFPSFYESFFHSRNVAPRGLNSPGYKNKGFDELADRLLRATTIEEAKDAVWEIERTLAEDLPYILLFDTGILEFYRQGAVRYPFTESLDGLQNLHAGRLAHATVNTTR